VILKIATAAPSEKILGAALEAATRAAQAEITTQQIPSIQEAIRRGVRWRPEPPGTGEELALPSTVIERGWGDCDDLAPWLAAELRATGRDPGARAVAYRSAPRRWHAVVRTSDGRTLDPSVWAGMRRDSEARVSGEAILPALAGPGQGAAAVVPDGQGRWHARIDLPSRRHPLHLCACAHDEDPAAALIRAAQTAAYAVPARARQIDQIAGCLTGSPEDDPEILGFLDSLVRTAAGVVSSLPVVGPAARPIAQAVAPAVQAVAPAAAAAAPFFGPAGVGALAALPAVQSLLAALAAGGEGQPALPAMAPALPATPIQPGVPALSLPLPIPGLAQPGQIAWSATPGQPSPVVVRWGDR
jgi:hypothetical protein